MNFFIPQLNDNDCGFACLKMVIAIKYQNENALYIKQDENHPPYSFQELKEMGEEYGLSFEGVNIEDKKEINKGEFPIIALLKKKNDLYHYVVIKKVKWGTVYYLDPQEGECSSSINSFNKIWTGDALLITNFEKKDIIYIDKVGKENKGNLLTPILQILSAISLAVGIYFLDEKTNIYIPLMFLSLSIISEIFLRIELVKRMERIDKSFVSRININKGQYLSFYQRYEEYKRLKIASNMNVIFAFICIIFITIIILLNNIYNAFLVLIPLLIAIIDIKFVLPNIKQKEEVIALEEKELSTLKNIDLLKKQIDKLHIRGYKIARVTLLKRYIYLSILLVTALLTTVFNETFSLPYVIFYFAITYMLLEQYINFLRYPSSKVEYYRSKVRLNNILS